MRTLLVLLSLTTLVHAEQPSKDPDDRVATLVKYLRSTDASTRVKAAKALKEVGPTAAAQAGNALSQATLDNSPQVRQAALEAIEKVLPKLYKPVSTILIDSDATKRASAFEDLKKMGADAEPVAALLAGLIRREAFRPGDAANQTVVNCISVLAETNTKNPDAIKTLADPVAFARMETARKQAILTTLQTISGDDAAIRKLVYGVFKASMTDTDASLATMSIRQVGTYGSDAKDALPTLKKMKLSGNALIRDAATEAVMAIESK